MQLLSSGGVGPSAMARSLTQVYSTRAFGTVVCPHTADSELARTRRIPREAPHCRSLTLAARGASSGQTRRNERAQVYSTRAFGTVVRPHTADSELARTQRIPREAPRAASVSERQFGASVGATPASVGLGDNISTAGSNISTASRDLSDNSSTFRASSQS
ncbi:hypothetical protein DFH09DRAFT_1104714 [Mycena vulgaris]|nr:hypothetical protein DFH09DRAFT_1104714 [Mycena vulgaris]